MTLVSHDTGSHIVSTGVLTVTTAGTKVQMSDQRCKRVLIQADEDNGTTIMAIGDTNVDADSNPPRGRMLYATQAEAFYCQNTNELYVDATVNSGKIHFITEG